MGVVSLSWTHGVSVAMCVCLELFAVAGRRVLDSCTRVSVVVSVAKMSCVPLCYHFLYLYDNRGRKG
jgi:hypothetical protein